MVFQADGSFSPGPMAKFLDMPQSPLFTLNLNTPESWMVESVRTRYDLDNIYLEEVTCESPAYTPAASPNLICGRVASGQLFITHFLFFFSGFKGCFIVVLTPY